MFLFETLGGLSEPVVRLFRQMKDKVRNKLTKRHIASAWEIATEMQLAGGGSEAPSSDEEGAATA
eukprot:scaffold4008_cov55-Phaeocystis_antarctica.AAC.2